MIENDEQCFENNGCMPKESLPVDFLFFMASLFLWNPNFYIFCYGTPIGVVIAYFI
jgi:hypothetical protein